MGFHKQGPTGCRAGSGQVLKKNQIAGGLGSGRSGEIFNQVHLVYSQIFSSIEVLLGILGT